MPFITSMSNTEIASIMVAMSWLVPERVMVLRALSALMTALRGEIGSRMRFISAAATYLSWMTSTRDPSRSFGSAVPLTPILPVKELSAATIL
jgi:hypothetical protein